MGYTVNEEFFSNIDTEEKAYFLGLLYADGSVYDIKGNYKITLSLKDKELVESFGRAIGSDSPVRTYEKINMHTIVICNKNLVKQMAEYGCVSPKAKTIRVPAIKDSLFHHFVRGYFDGDGSLSFDRSGNPIFNIASNEYFIMGLAERLRKILGIKVYIYPNPKTCLLAVRKWRDVVKITSWLYVPASIYLQRKFSLYKEIEKRYPAYLQYRKDGKGINYSREFLIHLYKENKTWRRVAEIIGYHPDYLKTYRRSIGLTNYKD